NRMVVADAASSGALLVVHSPRSVALDTVRSLPDGRDFGSAPEHPRSQTLARQMMRGLAGNIGSLRWSSSEGDSHGDGSQPSLSALGGIAQKIKAQCLSDTPSRLTDVLCPPAMGRPARPYRARDGERLRNAPGRCRAVVPRFHSTLQP